MYTQHNIDRTGLEQTLQGLLEEIAKVELRLTEEAGIDSHTPRSEIISKLQSGTLVETETVSRWIELYSSLTRW